MRNSDTPPPSPVLVQILREAKQCRAQGRQLLAVFDLDSTLFDLTLRIAMIVDSFTGDPLQQARFPSECARARQAQILPTDWGIQESLDRVGLTRDRHTAFVEALHQHWVKHFFANDHLKHDVPLPGALRFVLTLRSLGADVMYLTGRDIPRMLKGTQESLQQHGFPLDDQCAKLVLKPDAKLDDAQFKVDVLRGAQASYDRIWLFENEPVNLNLMARECPEIGLVFLETTHSGREEVDAALARIPHFEVDVSEFLLLP